MNARATVVVLGAGGVGHPCVAALAHATDVQLRIVDEDRVELSNQHRLLLARDEDTGRHKVDVLLAHLRSCGRVGDEAVVDRAHPENIERLLADADVVIDAVDNYASRFLAADVSALLGKPVVHGAAVRWQGTVFATDARTGPCYRCVFEDLPDDDTVDCATAGIFGPVTSLIGAVMAAYALRVVRGDRTVLGEFASYDALTNRFRVSHFARRNGCPLCDTRVLRDLDPTRYQRTICAA